MKSEISMDEGGGHPLLQDNFIFTEVKDKSKGRGGGEEGTLKAYIYVTPT